MLRVSGPAHVYLGGAPTTGVLEARVSTTGQYLCEFNTNTKEAASRDQERLALESDGDEGHRRGSRDLPARAGRGSVARRRSLRPSGVTASSERTAPPPLRVFEKFAEVQDALGDACLPSSRPRRRLLALTVPLRKRYGDRANVLRR